MNKRPETDFKFHYIKKSKSDISRKNRGEKKDECNSIIVQRKE